nr:keratin-associated protein 10-7-like isoform X2 [Equus asinus]
MCASTCICMQGCVCIYARVCNGCACAYGCRYAICMRAHLCTFLWMQVCDMHACTSAHIPMDAGMRYACVHICAHSYGCRYAICMRAHLRTFLWMQVCDMHACTPVHIPMDAGMRYACVHICAHSYGCRYAICMRAHLRTFLWMQVCDMHACTSAHIPMDAGACLYSCARVMPVCRRVDVCIHRCAYAGVHRCMHVCVDACMYARPRCRVAQQTSNSIPLYPWAVCMHTFNRLAFLFNKATAPAFPPIKSLRSPHTPHACAPAPLAARHVLGSDLTLPSTEGLVPEDPGAPREDHVPVPTRVWQAGVRSQREKPARPAAWGQ